jgi:ATP-dependent DNA helicase RecG
MVHAGRIIPIYSQTAELTKAGLSSKGLRRLTSYVFDHLEEKPADPLPEVEREEHQLPALYDAIHDIHYPNRREDIEAARRRLSFDELLSLQAFVFHVRGKKKSIMKNHEYRPPGETMSGFIRDLPYELTKAQEKVLAEIVKDLRAAQPMSRLLHGDVGCGKTVVAVLASLFVAENSLQTAFMAPTEILAEQHFRNWSGPLSDVGIRAELLTAGLKAAEKNSIAERTAGGETQILFGTHALIFDYVSFQKLGLVIIDEQHRFGVQQRGKLYAKGDNPDLLVMTATPIPRTLALTLYGDLDVSTIDNLPPGRLPVKTVWRTSDVKEKVYGFATDEVAKGGQVYIVYPLIGKSERSDLQSVEEAAEELVSGPFRNQRVGIVHGRMKAKDRDDVLEQFRNGTVDILLGTTVIEVGLDNPNATLMIIEHAERFGLAQLHQLRGRVGRGSRKSVVVALAREPISDIGRQRLEYFSAHTDGFQIAEADLKLRGPGEIFGLRQSGLPQFKAVDIWRDQDLLVKTRTLLERLHQDRSQLDMPYRELLVSLESSTRMRQIALGGG